MLLTGLEMLPAGGAMRYLGAWLGRGARGWGDLSEIRFYGSVKRVGIFTILLGVVVAAAGLAG